MDIEEKRIIEMQFERNLDLLIKQKFPLTATAIVSAEQPMILLFKELIYRIEKREYELEKKDKIINEMKWKPISKYNRKEYDWVLVKYFDGDYECVPGVAEKRSDDRWYNLSGEIIPFEVKYFFDMQILDYFTNTVEEDIKE